jgi:hypothetical protein
LTKLPFWVVGTIRDVDDIDFLTCFDVAGQKTVLLVTVCLRYRMLLSIE